MDARQLAVAATVRESLDRTLSSGIIKDRGFEDGAAVHVMDVEVAKGCLLARVLWEPSETGADADRIERALKRKSGILKKHVNAYVNQRYAVSLEFVRFREEAAQRHDELFAAMRADLERSQRGK